MVDIDFIKTTACPVCGCHLVCMESVRIESDTHKVLRHANGTTWEVREFACGYRVQYVPNFCREEVIHGCSFDPALAKQKALRKQAKEAINKQINESGCDDVYKDRLRQAIAYI